MIITDEKMPDMRGMELLSEAKRMDPEIPVILITAYGSVSMAVEALKQGAFYFFEKPIFNNLEQFLAIIRQALKAQEMERETRLSPKGGQRKIFLPEYHWESSQRCTRFLRTSEGWPRPIRPSSSRERAGQEKTSLQKPSITTARGRDKPLVTVHCGALTDTLLTSELFGHTRGAFTGAIKDKIGRFQMADGGTLVLDEIGEVPLHLQKTLLRVIEDKEFERVGDSRPVKVDVRIISATNRNLKEEVDKGNFREDLYYRLSIVPITIPPLRERVSDIPLLVKHFLKQYQGEKGNIRIEPEVVEYLKTCPWSGNVRELANILQQMMVLCRGDTITINDLPPYLLLKEESIRGRKSGRSR